VLYFPESNIPKYIEVLQIEIIYPFNLHTIFNFDFFFNIKFESHFSYQFTGLFGFAI
jgi:hypothetical protein